jgi:hypothetical protein
MEGCALVGSRQILSVGGNDNTKMNGWRYKDPWKQSIGVLEWEETEGALSYSAI